MNNSSFTNSTSIVYGGSISIEDSNASILNSKFNNTKTINTIGGCIYSQESNLTLFNTSISDSNANIGPGICQLNGSLNIANSSFINNHGNSYAGAVFAIYSNLNITDSNFINNTAKYGGALDIDGLRNIQIINNNFTNNSAINGGEFWSYNNDFNYSNNNYEGNTAEYEDMIFINL
jgi:hypothetical protein